MHCLQRARVSGGQKDKGAILNQHAAAYWWAMQGQPVCRGSLKPSGWKSLENLLGPSSSVSRAMICSNRLSVPLPPRARLVEEGGQTVHHKRQLP